MRIAERPEARKEDEAAGMPAWANRVGAYYGWVLVVKDRMGDGQGRGKTYVEHAVDAAELDHAQDEQGQDGPAAVLLAEDHKQTFDGAGPRCSLLLLCCWAEEVFLGFDGAEVEAFEFVDCFLSLAVVKEPAW